MLNPRTGPRLALAVVVSVSALALPVGRAQQKDVSSATNASPLAPADDVEIRQLVARYAYAVDTGADNG